MSISSFMPLSSPTYSGSKYASGYAFCAPMKSQILSTSGVSTKAHCTLTISLPCV
jgi:hypothetical protein